MSQHPHPSQFTTATWEFLFSQRPSPSPHNLKPLGRCVSTPRKLSLTFDKTKRKGGGGDTEVLGTQEQGNPSTKLVGAFE